MADNTNVADFESIYAAAEQTEGVIPHDIGGPQPVVEQLVAYGALRGEVFDPGTGDGHRWPRPVEVTSMVRRPRGVIREWMPPLWWYRDEMVGPVRQASNMFRRSSGMEIQR